MRERGIGPLDVLLIQRAPVDLYPPTLNQANLLAQCGLRVGLVDLATGHDAPSGLNPSIARLQVQRAWDSKRELAPSPWRRWLNVARFRAACTRTIRRRQPRVVIGYDFHAMVFATPQPGLRRTVFHFHELSELEPGMGWSTRRAIRQSLALSRSADLVVHADVERARHFQCEAGLPVRPSVVMNCPARMGSVPESGLRGWLAEQGLRPRQIVCYLGSIGTNQGLPEAAASMRYWPPDTLLVLVGQASDSTRQGILAAARCAEGQRQVIFTGAKPHGEALALTAGADVALSLIQPKSLNLKFSAGAVNKRFEYMALGVPQVTDNGPGVSDIIERHQCGLCVDPQSPEAIGRAVRTLLDDGARRHTFAAAARQAHLERFYYERQFTPVADWIGAHCKPH